MKITDYMKRYSLILTLAAAVALSTSCMNDDDLTPDTGQAGSISFTTDLPATRALPFEETGANAYNSMGVYATVNGTSNLMTNQQVTRTSGSNGWSYAPLVSWPGNDKAVTFYAYAPHGAIVPTQTAGQMPVANSFIVAATASGNAGSQTDLLMAEVVSNTRDTLTSDVRLTMRHVLTRVLFSARTRYAYSNNVSSIRITGIELSGLNNRADHEIDANSFWTNQSGNATYTLNGTGLVNADLTHTALTEVSSASGNLYLMPQVIPAGAKLKVTVATKNASPTPITTTQDYTFDLVDLLDEMKQGEAIRFLLTVPNTASPEAFKIEVLHADWNAPQNIDADIERNPVLYISNETIYAYDGAVACVYFSSNIPIATNAPFNQVVYIEDQGRISSTTGTPFHVADEFYAIAQNDPDRENMTLGYTGAHVNNLRYEYDAASGLYKGHIDIVIRKTTEAGETPNQGKNLLILKLHVGKIVRDIAVQRVVTTEAAKKNPTRYIGTFHRHHETGERLVTWYEPETTTWRVEVDNTAGTGADEIQLDSRISPDFRNKQLYSLVARDPEGTRVENNPNLFGRGRVYFRVGWRTPTAPGINRYARVKVTLQHHDDNGNPTTQETHYLYCRQGETPEQVAAAPSEYALFNVAAPGQFAKYPTQTGMLYQWNRITPWSPLGEAKPYGWNTGKNAGYETDFSYEHSACPDGFAYPSDIQELEMKAVFGSGGTAKERGYYADGYFDRRAITYNGANPTKDEHRVNASQSEVGAIGTILFNAANAHSIFLVSGGLREEDGKLLAYELTGHDDHGVHGGYWFNILGTTADQAKGAMIFKQTTDADIKEYSKQNAFSLRCIRTSGWLVYFDTNGGENGPRNMTVPANITSITLPTTVPNNYYRDNFEFKGWTAAQDGSGTLYTAGQMGVSLPPFGAATKPVKLVKLYAKWGAPRLIIDFRTFASIPNSYLYNISTNASDPYATLTITSNGTAYPVADSQAKALSYFAGPNKAYPILEYSPVQAAATYANAYQTCKSMVPAGTWRLPRAQESILVQEYTTRGDELLGPAGNEFWTGTSCSTGGDLFSFRSWGSYTASSTVASTTKAYRCVRPAP